MNEQKIYESPDQFEKEDRIKEIRKTFNRCGFAVFGLTAFSVAISVILGFALENADPALVSTYYSYRLVVNEILIALAVAVGALVLIGSQRNVPTRTKVDPKFFFLMLCISFPIVAVGNMLGNTITSFFNIFSGSETLNPIAELLMEISPWQTALCAGILAPILEELFFRKLLIDRMRRHGDAAAIIVSALLFGLFHQNFSQFFYTFGLGLLLGYLYCRTGSYIAVTLYHMVFNFIMGVLPAIFLPDLMKVLTDLASLEGDIVLEVVLSMLAAVAPSLIYFIIHITVIGILNLTGAILFFINVKKIKLESDGSSLSMGARLKAALVNPGMIASFILLSLLMISSVF